MLQRQEGPWSSSEAAAEEAKCMHWKLQAQEKHTRLHLVLWAGTYLCTTRPKKADDYFTFLNPAGTGQRELDVVLSQPETPPCNTMVTVTFCSLHPSLF